MRKEAKEELKVFAILICVIWIIASAVCSEFNRLDDCKFENDYAFTIKLNAFCDVDDGRGK